MSSEVEVELKVVYFASARECVGKESEVLRIEGTREDGQGEASTTTLALEKVLVRRGGNEGRVRLRRPSAKGLQLTH